MCVDVCVRYPGTRTNRFIRLENFVSLSEFVSLFVFYVSFQAELGRERSLVLE